MYVQTLIRTRRQLLRCLRRLRAPPSHAHMVRSCARPHLLRALGQCDPLHQDRLRASRHPKRRRTIGVSLRWRALYACRRYRTCRCSHNKTSLASRLTHGMATRYQTLACPNYRAVRLLLYRRFKRFGCARLNRQRSEHVSLRVDGSARVPARTAHCAQSPRLRYRFYRSRYRQPHWWR